MTRLLLLMAMLTAAGCHGRRVAAHAPSHGNLLEVASKQAERAARHEARNPRAPLVVLIENKRLRAVDPSTATQRWSLPLKVHGHPVASADSIYVPISGHRLVALDRWTGQRRWEAPLPGEAVTGLDVSEPYIVVSVIDHRKGRSRLAGLSVHDGQLRWLRRSSERFGVPAAAGNVALVSHGTQVLAFSMATGREKARVDVPGRSVSDGSGAPSLEQVAFRRRSLLAGEGAQWVDLATSIGGRIEGIQTVDDEYAAVFRRIDGLDPGHADAERLRLSVDFATTADAPRAAILLCRRAVVAMRLSPRGRAAVAQWAHVAPTDLEYVAMDTGKAEVTLVREDGQIVRLDRRSGVVLDRVKGGDPVRGALILGGELSTEGTRATPSVPRVRGMLVELVDDPDPRLLPAQRLALDLLWRDEDPRARDVVTAIAQSRRRPETHPAAVALRRHALDRVAGPWGRPDTQERDRVDSQLRERPSFLDDRQPAVAVLARRAVAAGSPDLVPQLIEHLLHPATEPGDLDEVVVALTRLHHPGAVEGVAEFVRRYHADPQVVHESPAVVRAVDLLLGYAGSDPEETPQEVRQAAHDVLQEAADDPFTEASLRAYIAPRLAQLPTSGEPQRDQADDAQRPPRLTALSDPGL